MVAPPTTENPNFGNDCHRLQAQAFTADKTIQRSHNGSNVDPATPSLARMRQPLKTNKGNMPLHLNFKQNARPLHQVRINTNSTNAMHTIENQVHSGAPSQNAAFAGQRPPQSQTVYHNPCSNASQNCYPSNVHSFTTSSVQPTASVAHLNYNQNAFPSKQMPINTNFTNTMHNISNQNQNVVPSQNAAISGHTNPQLKNVQHNPPGNQPFYDSSLNFYPSQVDSATTSSAQPIAPIVQNQNMTSSYQMPMNTNSTNKMQHMYNQNHPGAHFQNPVPASQLTPQSQNPQNNQCGNQRFSDSSQNYNASNFNSSTASSAQPTASVVYNQNTVISNQTPIMTNSTNTTHTPNNKNINNASQNFNTSEVDFATTSSERVDNTLGFLEKNEKKKTPQSATSVVHKNYHQNAVPSGQTPINSSSTNTMQTTDNQNNTADRVQNHNIAGHLTPQSQTAVSQNYNLSNVNSSETSSALPAVPVVPNQKANSSDEMLFNTNTTNMMHATENQNYNVVPSQNAAFSGQRTPQLQNFQHNPPGNQPFYDSFQNYNASNFNSSTASSAQPIASVVPSQNMFPSYQAPIMTNSTNTMHAPKNQKITDVPFQNDAFACQITPQSAVSQDYYLSNVNSSETSSAQPTVPVVPNQNANSSHQMLLNTNTTNMMHVTDNQNYNGAPSHNAAGQNPRQPQTAQHNASQNCYTSNVNTSSSVQTSQPKASTVHHNYNQNGFPANQMPNNTNSTNKMQHMYNQNDPGAYFQNPVPASQLTPQSQNPQNNQCGNQPLFNAPQNSHASQIDFTTTSSAPEDICDLLNLPSSNTSEDQCCSTQQHYNYPDSLDSHNSSNVTDTAPTSSNALPNPYAMEDTETDKTWEFDQTFTYRGSEHVKNNNFDNNPRGNLPFYNFSQNCYPSQVDSATTSSAQPKAPIVQNQNITFSQQMPMNTNSTKTMHKMYNQNLTGAHFQNPVPASQLTAQLQNPKNNKCGNRPLVNASQNSQPSQIDFTTTSLASLEDIFDQLNSPWSNTSEDQYCSTQQYFNFQDITDSHNSSNVTDTAATSSNALPNDDAMEDTETDLATEFDKMFPYNGSEQMNNENNLNYEQLPSSSAGLSNFDRKPGSGPVYVEQTSSVTLHAQSFQQNIHDTGDYHAINNNVSTGFEPTANAVMVQTQPTCKNSPSLRDMLGKKEILKTLSKEERSEIAQQLFERGEIVEINERSDAGYDQENEYHCDMCRFFPKKDGSIQVRTFNSLDQKYRHHRRHMNWPTHACEPCQEGFYKKNHYDDHMKKYHPHDPNRKPPKPQKNKRKTKKDQNDQTKRRRLQN